MWHEINTPDRPRRSSHGIRRSLHCALAAALFLLGCAGPLRAATVNVTSPPTRANFDTAYAAASAGDTILFPLNDSSTWTTSATIGKRVSIDLNGTTLSAGATLATGFFYYTGFNTTSFFELTNGTLDGVTIAGNHHLLKFEAMAANNYRVHHMVFKHADIQIEVGAGGDGGLFDHNVHSNANSGFYPSAGTRTQADASWVTMDAGTGAALIVEDCLFYHDAGWLGGTENNSWFDTNQGGKLTIRYCYFLAQNNSFTVPSTNATTGAAASWPLQGASISSIPAGFTGPMGGILTHGNAAGGEALGYWEASATTRRGQSVVEVYNCVFNARRIDYLAQLRGSANLIHDNILDTETFAPRLRMYEEEQYETQFDPLRTAWPAEDQVHNSFFWNNVLNLNGTPETNYDAVDVGSTDYIQKDRDYFMHAPEATGGKETFTGANGASGSHPTDGSPYTSQGTMTFSGSGANAYFGYVPYTYPHPAQGVLPGGTTSGGSSVIGGSATRL